MYPRTVSSLLSTTIQSAVCAAEFALDSDDASATVHVFASIADTARALDSHLRRQVVCADASANVECATDVCADPIAVSASSRVRGPGFSATSTVFAFDLLVAAT